MCTVSFVNTHGKIIITSNRDEQQERQSAHPRTYTINNKKIVFPKDPKAGGTWFALDESGTIAVLLNGAGERHISRPPYRKSRGLIVLDIISGNSAKLEWESIDLENIEPFTLVLYQEGELFRMRWNGALKETRKLDASENHIWSSTTLYPEEIRNLREEWFATFLEKSPVPQPVELYDFHRHTQEQNKENGLVIDRSGLLKTVSITQSVIDDGKISMSHHDLVAELEFADSFLIV